ncbi:MAG: hypothetical protein HY817_02575 [Candidatus Abawacabacteria bacterium]|nr:hypothetical protein [Candidatus Abawacabacteria bacterium]
MTLANLNADREVEERFAFSEQQRGVLRRCVGAKLKAKKYFVNFGIEHREPLTERGLRIKGNWLRARVANPDQAMIKQMVEITQEKRLALLIALGLRPKFTLKLPKPTLGFAQEFEDVAGIAAQLGSDARNEAELLERLQRDGYTIDAGFSTRREEYGTDDGMILTADDSTCIHTGISGYFPVIRQVTEVEIMAIAGAEAEARAKIRDVVTGALGDVALTAAIPSTIIACVSAHTDPRYVARLIEAERIVPAQLSALVTNTELPLDHLHRILSQVSVEMREALSSLFFPLMRNL